MLLKPIAAAAGTVGALSIWACTSCNSSSSPVSGDGGVDSHKAQDAHVDGAPDGGQFETSIPDAGYDPFVGSWVPIPGSPSLCVTRYTTAPEKDISEWNFAPCASNRPGCGRFVQGWSTLGGEVMRFPKDEPVMLVGGKPYIAYYREWSNQLGIFAEQSVVQELSGKARLAVGSWTQVEGDGCNARAYVGLAGPGILQSVYVAGKTSAQFGLFGWSTLSPLAPLHPPVSEQTLGGQFFPALARGTTDDAYTMHQAGGGGIPVWHANNTLTVVAGINSEAPRAIQGMAVVIHYDPPFGLRLVKPDGTWSQIQSSGPNRITNAFAFDRSAQDSLVWVESEFGDNNVPYKNSRLWTSPFATTAAALQPRLVAAVDDVIGYGGAYFVANAGVVLYRVSDTIARVVRLSDGWGWDFAPESGDAFMYPLWVDDDSVWVAIADAPTAYEKRHVFGVSKLSRMGLGSPTVPPGLP